MIYKTKSKNNKKSRFSFRPDFIAQSVHQINFKKLAEFGITNALVDLDNTVVERNKFEVSPEVIKALKNSKLNIYIATNRPKARSLKNLKKDLSAAGVVHPYIIFPKPTKTYFKQAARKHGLIPNKTVMIGDMFIQDVLGANRSGMYSLLVSKLGKAESKLDRLVSKIQHAYTEKISKDYFK